METHPAPADVMKLPSPVKPNTKKFMKKVHYMKQTTLSTKRRYTMRRTYTTSGETTFNGHPIVNQICDKNILGVLDRTMSDFVNRHCKALFFRTDLDTPLGCTDASNHALSKTMEHMQKKLAAQGIDSAYVATREEKNGRQHYHTGCLVDGSKIRTPYTIQQEMGQEFEHQLGLPPNRNHGCMDDCSQDKYGQFQTNAHLIKRKDPDSYDEAFQRASYLAKAATKPQSGRQVFSSHVRKQ